MNNCSTCKHWKNPRAGYVGFPSYGECMLAESNDGEAAYADSLAFSMDVEAYGSGLYCKPEFGCVQHEPKEAK